VEVFVVCVITCESARPGTEKMATRRRRRRRKTGEG